MNQSAAKIRVGTASGHAEESPASCELTLPNIPPGLFGHIMNGFQHNLVGIGSMCDKGCRVLFTEHAVVIYDKEKKNVSDRVARAWRS